MRILLFSNIKGPEPYLPLNLLALATYAKACGHQADIVDGQVDAQWLDRCVALAGQADAVGVSSYTGPSINAVLVLLKELRKRGIRKPVVWGGYHGTLANRKIIGEGWADFVVQGYGEHALIGILDHLAGKTDIGDIPNVSYRDENGKVKQNRRTKIDFLDELPPMDYSFVEVPKYYVPGRQTLQYISSYGCPYACTFCAEPAHSLRRWRGFSVERVVQDMKRLDDLYHPRMISFVDPNISSQPARVAALAEALILAGSRVPILCNMRSRDVLEIEKIIPLDRLRAAGFRKIFIGIESGDDEQLKSLKKSATASFHHQAVMALDRAEIEVQMSFIHDLPEESDAQAKATLELAENLLDVKTRGSYQSHHFYMPYPGTELFDTVFPEENSYDQVPTEDWARTSTFQANRVWQGDPDRRRWVVGELEKFHTINPAVVRKREIGRLRQSAAVGDDYLEHFLL
ncbi:B12-binding domain-containing radical SAM protein [Streptomyces sp. NPDC002669]|uniref:B12-binding domain-containing radical SAM protein n=1 Tax=Streptomyces sp. NPDC002669 TaxID=3364658 RepID=UPI0036893424